MSRQLDSWRSLLPRPLQWYDSEKPQHCIVKATDERPKETLSALSENVTPVYCDNHVDILDAQLRSRFYYTRYMLFRPYVYKALHYPDLMTVDDKSCCAIAIQASCLWPLIMPPRNDRKRLLPHLFTWTNNSIGILLILYMVRHNRALWDICNERIDHEDTEGTIALMLDWLEDMGHVDVIAQWALKILEPIFQATRTSIA
jgi:hypothetical protein